MFKTLGFIGAGSMTEALVRGIVEAGIVKGEDILITNKENIERLDRLTKHWGLRQGSKAELVQGADVIVLAVKPKDIAIVMKEIGPEIRPGQLVISVAAGIPTSFIEGFCKENVGVIRAMPNTSCTVLASATALSRGKYAASQDEKIALKLFSAVGKVEVLPEEHLDIVTGLSGSGPAYVYYMVEALEQAGEKLGLSRDMALNLAAQTVFGAAKMLLETGERPGSLRSAVSSPGGTTLAGLQELSAHGFVEALNAAVLAAAQRSKEMGMEFTGGAGGAVRGL